MKGLSQKAGGLPGGPQVPHGLQISIPTRIRDNLKLENDRFSAMGLFKKIFQKSKQDEIQITVTSSKIAHLGDYGEDLPPLNYDESEFLTEIGNTEPVCPYCNAELEKFPQRKKKCPNCGNPIYSRSRPLDRKKTLIREDEVSELEKEWSKLRLFREFELEYRTDPDCITKTAGKLSEKFGYKAAFNDVLWSVYSKQRAKYASKGYWGYYRNSTMKMGQMLSNEGKYDQSLNFMLETLYLDLNGPDNHGHFNPNRPNEELFAPGILQDIQKIASKGDFSDTKIAESFILHNTTIYKALKLPLSPEEAWKQQQILTEMRVNEEYPGLVYLNHN